MNNVFNALSINELEALVQAHKDDVELVKEIESIIKAKQEQEQQEQVKEQFKLAIDKLTKKLPEPPAGVYNIYLRFADVPDLTQPEVEVKLPDGKVEMRRPLIKTWVAELNKATTIGTSKTSTKASKRKIDVYKVNLNTQHLDKIGTFNSGADACKTLGLDVGANSANRVLKDNGYIIQPAS